VGINAVMLKDITESAIREFASRTMEYLSPNNKRLPTKPQQVAG
jgi:hypothetical protein